MSCMSEKTDGNDKEKIAGGNRLTASFYGKEFRIHFAKDILRVLGKPHYICIKVNKDLSSFIITSCEGKMNMSFHVPESLFSENGVKMRIGSQGFVLDLYLKNGMDVGQTYRVDGIYLRKHNAVVFNMKEAVLFEGLPEENIE